MADQPNNGTSGTPQSAEGQPTFQARVLGQYIKVLSFEKPSVGRLQQAPGDKPNLQIEVNVNADRGQDVPSAIEFQGSCHQQRHYL